MSKDAVEGNLVQVIRNMQRRISALERQQNDVGQLSELSSDMGLVTAGEFRAGNGVEPGEGFSGVRMTADGVSGYDNDVLQAGLSATDGKITAGAGAVTLNADGISIETIDTPDTDKNSLRFMSSADKYSAVFSDVAYGNSLSVKTYGISGIDSYTNLNAIGASGQNGTIYIKADSIGGIKTGILLDSTGSIMINNALRDVNTSIFSGTGAVLTVDGGDNDVDIATKMNFGDTGAITGGAETINDDAAFSFTPATARGVLILRSGGAATTVYGMFTYAAVTGTAYCYAWTGAGSAMAATTGALGGTTGTDGKVTVSAHTDGKIYIENRAGGNLSFAWQIVAGT